MSGGVDGGSMRSRTGGRGRGVRAARREQTPSSRAAQNAALQAWPVASTESILPGAQNAEHGGRIGQGAARMPWPRRRGSPSAQRRERVHLDFQRDIGGQRRHARSAQTGHGVPGSFARRDCGFDGERRNAGSPPCTRDRSRRVSAAAGRAARQRCVHLHRRTLEQAAAARAEQRIAAEQRVVAEVGDMGQGMPRHVQMSRTLSPRSGNSTRSPSASARVRPGSAASSGPITGTWPGASNAGNSGDVVRMMVSQQNRG